MADNITLNAGVGGDTLAANDVSGVKYQRTKAIDPTAGSSAAIGVAANPWRTDPTGTTAQPVTNAGTFAVQVDGAALTAIQLIDDTVATLGSAAATKGLQVAGSDGTNARTLKTDSAGELQVDVLTLPAVDTELPAAAALADAAGNPTTPTAGSAGLVFNGSTWDRARGMAAGVTTIAPAGIAGAALLGHFDDAATGAVTEDQFGSVRISSRRALRVEGVASGDPMPGNVTQLAGTAISVNNGGANAGCARVVIATDSQGGNIVDNAAFTDGTTRIVPVGYIFDETAGTALTENDCAAARIDSKRAQVGVIEDETTRGQRASVRSEKALAVALTTSAGGGGATPYKLISAASTNGTNVKASAGTLYSLQVNNVNAAVRYVKLYNKASAPTVGTDTPVHTFAIPKSDGNLEMSWPNGINFATGIGFGLTTGVADADTGAVSANEHVVNLTYK